jgi:hypothetical protein
MRISERIKSASVLVELEKQAINLSPAALAAVNVTKNVVPKFSGRLNQGSKLFGNRIFNAPTKINSAPVLQINPRVGATGGNSLRIANPPAPGSLSISRPVNSTSLGLSNSIQDIGGVNKMIVNNARGMTVGVRGATPNLTAARAADDAARAAAGATPAAAAGAADDVARAAAGATPAAAAGAADDVARASQTAATAADDAAGLANTAGKEGLLARLKGMSPGRKTALIAGGSGLGGAGIGAWWNSGSGYDDAMQDTQMMMRNQQMQYEDALGRLQNRGLFDRIMNTGG